MVITIYRATTTIISVILQLAEEIRFLLGAFSMLLRNLSPILVILLYDPNMDPMEIMMEMTGFRRIENETRKNLISLSLILLYQDTMSLARLAV